MWFSGAPSPQVQIPTAGRIMSAWQRLRISPEQQPAECEGQHVVTLERSPYSGGLRRNTSSSAHAPGMVAARRVIQHPPHATALFELQ
jgi:hypothetical protein